MTLQIELTGNEARFLFFSIKNKKSDMADRVRQKLLAASDTHFLKSQKNGKQNENSSRFEEGRGVRTVL